MFNSYLPNHNWAYTPDTLKYNYDPEYAKQCLADSGWTDTDGDGLVDKDGQTLKLEIGCGKRESDNVMLEAAQNYLRQVGIDVSMAVLENAAYNERLHGADFQAYVLNLSQDSPEPALVIDFSFPTGQVTTSSAMTTRALTNWCLPQTARAIRKSARNSTLRSRSSSRKTTSAYRSLPVMHRSA